MVLSVFPNIIRKASLDCKSAAARKDSYEKVRDTFSYVGVDFAADR